MGSSWWNRADQQAVQMENSANIVYMILRTKQWDFSKWIIYLPPCLASLSFETSLLLNLKVINLTRLTDQMSFRDLLVSSTPMGLQTCAIMPGFLPGFWEFSLRSSCLHGQQLSDLSHFPNRASFHYKGSCLKYLVIVIETGGES